MSESTENCMKTGDCFALLAMTFETCDLLNFIYPNGNLPPAYCVSVLTANKIRSNMHQK